MRLGGTEYIANASQLLEAEQRGGGTACVTASPQGEIEERPAQAEGAGGESQRVGWHLARATLLDVCETKVDGAQAAVETGRKAAREVGVCRQEVSPAAREKDPAKGPESTWPRAFRSRDWSCWREHLVEHRAGGACTRWRLGGWLGRCGQDPITVRRKEGARGVARSGAGPLSPGGHPGVGR